MGCPNIKRDPSQNLWFGLSRFRMNLCNADVVQTLYTVLAAVSEALSLSNKGQVPASVICSDCKGLWCLNNHHLPWFSTNSFCSADYKPLCYQALLSYVWELAGKWANSVVYVVKVKAHTRHGEVNKKNRVNEGADSQALVWSHPQLSSSCCYHSSTSKNHWFSNIARIWSRDICSYTKKMLGELNGKTLFTRESSTTTP